TRDAAIAEDRAMKFLVDPRVAQRKRENDIDDAVEERHARLSPAFVASPRALDGAVRRVVERRRPRNTLLHGRSMEAVGEIVGVDDDDVLPARGRREEEYGQRETRTELRRLLRPGSLSLSPYRPCARRRSRRRSDRRSRRP